MTTDQFLSNYALVKHWGEGFKSETFKEVYAAMDESSPIYQDISILAEESPEAKYWFTKGYYFYHGKVKELSQFQPRPVPLKPQYKPHAA